MEDLFRTADDDVCAAKALPTVVSYVRSISNSRSDATLPLILTLSLVPMHVLWGNHLWNGAKWIAKYIEEHVALVRGKATLELGAAAGLPSLIALLNGAACAVITDYPDEELVQNIRQNVEANLPAEIQSRAHAKGFLWGADTRPILQFLKEDCKFDLIILADVVFNHSEHRRLLSSCFDCLADDGLVLCSFTHYRPWLAAKDLEFFTLAKTDFNMKVEKIAEERVELMFENDRGDAEVRSTVHSYILRK